jgi:hypothetical protein
MPPAAPFSDPLVSLIVARSSEPLKHLRSVVSQLRSTKNPAKQSVQASFYIPLVLSPLADMYKSNPNLKAEYGIEWTARVADETLSTFKGVVEGVRRTEELLRRHRKSRQTKGLFGFMGTGTVSSAQGDEEDGDGGFKALVMADLEGLRKGWENMVDGQVAVRALKGWTEVMGALEGEVAQQG